MHNSIPSMFLQTPLYSTKKALYYSFFPTKDEEESSKSRTTTSASLNRVLIEIRDIHPPPFNPHNPWAIKKTLNQFETICGKLVVTWGDTFEHVIRYWELGVANQLVLGQRVGVAVWDFTEERYPKSYWGNDVHMQMMANEDYVLSCIELVKDRRLKVDDEICLFWDYKDNTFKFKVVL